MCVRRQNHLSQEKACQTATIKERVHTEVLVTRIYQELTGYIYLTDQLFLLFPATMALVKVHLNIENDIGERLSVPTARRLTMLKWFASQRNTLSLATC